MNTAKSNNLSINFLNEKIEVGNIIDIKRILSKFYLSWTKIFNNVNLPIHELGLALSHFDDFNKNLNENQKFITAVDEVNLLLNKYRFPTEKIIYDKLEDLDNNTICSYLLGAVFGKWRNLSSENPYLNHSYFIFGVLDHGCFNKNIDAYDFLIAKIKQQSDDVDKFHSVIKKTGESSAVLNSNFNDFINTQTEVIVGQIDGFGKKLSYEIDNAKKVAAEQLKLLKSFSYWKAKYRIHADKEKSSLCSLMIVSFALFFLVPLLIYFIKDKLPYNTGKFIDPLSIAIGVILALSFWVIRIMSKLWLSHSHLKNDAHERMVMTQTYLALSHEQGLDKDQKALFLSSVFKPVQDGIIKDDGPVSPLVELIAEIKKK